ncbi:hybrid sensor histidine kinase/response regulator [Woodsholea maritima]|uniref:hybrid sensor histidine kinase/response regulator n=1 Tax=Woodsholea maritima TaxID=240237 RepID=UPI0003783909|nr:PAS domain-containing sensor histidine kinase [Woodsholea maritima]
MTQPSDSDVLRRRDTIRWDDAVQSPINRDPQPMTDTIPQPAPSLNRIIRIVFWAAGLGALAAAGVAVMAASSAGWHGFVFLAGVAFVAFLLLYALAAGEAAARFLGTRPAKEAGGQSALAFGALEALPDPVLVTNERGQPRWANAAYRTLAHQAANLGASLTPPSADRIWAGAASSAIYRLAKAGANQESRIEVLGPITLSDGRAQVYQAHIRPMAGGAVWRFVEAKDETSTLSQDWAELAPVGLFMADGEGRVLAANATLRTWLGVSADAVLKVKDFLAGDGAKVFSKSKGQDEVTRLDARILAREGVESPVTLIIDWDDARPPRARVVVYGLSSTGAPPGVAQAMAPMTGKAGRTFDEMFAASPFGVARMDGADPESALLEDANPALLQLTGGAALPASRFVDLFDWSNGQSADEAFAPALAGRGEPVEMRLKAGADLRDVHLYLAPARGGKRVAYVVDITAWKELERQFSQAAKMQAVGQLAGGVAHDFNNLLTAMRLNVDELLGRHPVGDPSYQELQTINSAINRAAGLVKKLLAFSRKQTFRVETLDISDTLSDFSILLRQILEESVRLDFKHGRDLPLVRADKTQLENAIMNLATNARDAMREKGGGTLTITTESLTSEDVAKAGAPDPKEGRWLAIHVTDTGCGMDDATLGKIFEPFFTTKPAGQGTGLGLATVYGIVKQSGGFLFASSQIDVGTTFTIYLPEHIPSKEEQAQEIQDKAAAPVEVKPADLAGRGRILLVEDEDAVRAIAAKTLTKRGYEVMEACDGEEALEILEDNPQGFDLLISDVVMPGLDGPGLLEKGRELLGDARVVFISGYAEEQFSHTLSSDLEISFLPKPFTLPQLAERVKAELTLVQGNSEG